MSSTSVPSRVIPNVSCKRPTNRDPYSEPLMTICGTKTPSLTCRPAGRPWGRACGPVCLKNGRWMLPTNEINACTPVKIRGRKTKLPYGFGLYARKLYPYGLPCVGSFSLPKPALNESFYPMLPTKPGKIFSGYSFKTRGPPYTCPRPCIAC